MAINRQYIQGSNGSGEAVRSTVTSTRTAGSTIIAVNSLTNWSTNFIATTGSINADNTLNIKLVFKGHIDGTTLIIDEIAPGYTDPGSVIGDVVVLKPSTFWADHLAAFLDVAHNDDGNIASGYVATGMIADGSVTTAKLADGSVTAAKTTGLGWQEIGRTTVSTPGDVMDVSGLPARKYLMIKTNIVPSGQIGATFTFNGDTGSNYIYRVSRNGAADNTTTAVANLSIIQSGVAQDAFVELKVTNSSSREKLVSATYVTNEGSGASNLPDKGELGGKWANTAAQINRVTVTNSGTGDFAAGSEVIVWGHN